MPFPFTSIDLTKAFDLVSRDGLLMLSHRSLRLSVGLLIYAHNCQQDEVWGRLHNIETRTDERYGEGV